MVTCPLLPHESPSPPDDPRPTPPPPFFLLPPPPQRARHRLLRFLSPRAPRRPRHRRSRRLFLLRPRSTSSSVFESLLYKAAGGGPPTSLNSTSTSFLRPELRRCKSFSCGHGDSFIGPRTSTAFKPQHKSCNITLWFLFHQDDKKQLHDVVLPSSVATQARGEIEIECLSASVATPVLETREEKEEGKDDRDEIRVVDPVLVVGISGEIEGGVREEEATTQNPRKLSPQANWTRARPGPSLTRNKIRPCKSA